MRVLSTALIVLVLSSFSAQAQIFEGSYNAITEPMDRMEYQHEMAYADVPVPGAAEDAKPQDQLYGEMLTPVNEATVRHFETSNGIKTIAEQESQLQVQ